MHTLPRSRRLSPGCTPPWLGDAGVMIRYQPSDGAAGVLDVLTVT